MGSIFASMVATTRLVSDLAIGRNFGGICQSAELLIQWLKMNVRIERRYR